MPKHLLPISHHPQKRDGDCLAACVAMVLDYLERPIDYGRLVQLLKIQSYGAPASNVRLLAQLDLAVTYGVIDMTGLEDLLSQKQPLIVFVRTGELPHWEHNSGHAMVVVGYDENDIYVNDPYLSEAPLAIPRGDFELAWLERDYYYALITIP